MNRNHQQMLLWTPKVIVLQSTKISIHIRYHIVKRSQGVFNFRIRNTLENSLIIIFDRTKSTSQKKIIEYKMFS